MTCYTLGMLATHRDLRVPSLQVRYADHAILHSNYRVVLQIREGMVDDEALLLRHFDRHDGLDRSNVILSLDGEVRMRRPGAPTDAFLPPGGWITERRSSGWHLRREGRTSTLIIEWDPHLVGTRLIAPGQQGRLPAGTLAEARRLASPLAQATGPARAAPLVQRLLSLFRLEGLPLDPLSEQDLVEEVPAHFKALVQVVDPTLAALGEQPMLVDLQDALGRSRPTVLGHLRAFHKRYAYNASGGWRDLLQRWRVTMGACYMSSPLATTEGVAAALGYASPSAFCQAFANRGLPSPGAIASRLEALR